MQAWETGTQVERPPRPGAVPVRVPAPHVRNPPLRAPPLLRVHLF